MGKPMRKCRICGKEYEACKPTYFTGNPYRWQDVACCEEHGTEYFARVAASRSEGADIKKDEAEIVSEEIVVGNDEVVEPDANAQAEEQPDKKKKKKGAE